MSKSKGLGRGIDALFVTAIDKELLEEDRARIKFVSVTEIKPNREQPRTNFNEEALEELTSSIKRHGVLQPLIVISESSGYQIVAGERRWRAAQKAGLNEVPVIVRSLQELEKLEIALIENVQRVDLSPLEQALSIYRLHQQFNIDYNEIAARLGKAPTTVSNIVRLLQLPDDAAEALREGKISEGHARAILSLANQPKTQKELLKNIITLGWTVRQAEAFAAAAKSDKKVSSRSKSGAAVERNEELSKHLKLPVVIKKQKRGGQLIIRFSNEDELSRVTRLLSEN